jgi:MFS family permease
MDLSTVRHHWLFFTATSLVALHVADDNFVQPVAGTSAFDHLASGLIPLTLVALGAWFYPWVRAGAAASIAIAIGVLGLIVGAIEAGYYTTTVGPSGDDFTGLLAIPAGLALIGLGLVRLWTSRRKSPNRVWR